MHNLNAVREYRAVWGGGDDSDSITHVIMIMFLRLKVENQAEEKSYER